MELFSEIYSRYYRVAERVLEEAQDGKMTRSRMSRIIADYGFGESNLFLLPKLAGGEYQLLEPQPARERPDQEEAAPREDFFLPKLTHPTGYSLSFLQQSFVKALLDDPRLRLFLSEPERSELNTALSGVEPLFSWQDFYYFDQYLDGDPYELDSYCENFRMIFRALKEHHTLRILYQSGHGNLIRGFYAPYRLVYSQKDDCFRLLCAELSSGTIHRPAVLRISRVIEAAYALCDYPEEKELERLLEKPTCQEPVVIEIHDERNALERCMLHFANYEKQTIPSETAGIYYCKIFYKKEEETELLIRVLSFGPVIRVLGPRAFLNQVRERVARQSALLFQSTLN